MATRIVIMKDGYIQQIGAPIDIFNHPVNKFVAGFIGSPAMNFFPATYQDGKVTFVTGQKLTIPADLIKDKTIPEKVIFGIRPEDIHEGDGYHASLYPDAIFDAKVILAELLGNEYYVHTNFAFQDVIARFPSEHQLSPKDDIKFAMNLERCHLFDPQSEIAIF